MPKCDRSGRVTKDKITGSYIYEEKEVTKSIVNMDFIDKHNLTYKSEPFEWFDAFLPFKKSRQEALEDGSFTIGNWATYTKLRADLSNAGMFVILFCVLN